MAQRCAHGTLEPAGHDVPRSRAGRRRRDDALRCSHDLRPAARRAARRTSSACASIWQSGSTCSRATACSSPHPRAGPAVVDDAGSPPRASTSPPTCRTRRCRLRAATPSCTTGWATSSRTGSTAVVRCGRWCCSTAWPAGAGRSPPRPTTASSTAWGPSTSGSILLDAEPAPPPPPRRRRNGRRAAQRQRPRRAGGRCSPATSRPAAARCAIPRDTLARADRGRRPARARGADRGARCSLNGPLSATRSYRSVPFALDDLAAVTSARSAGRSTTSCWRSRPAVCAACCSRAARHRPRPACARRSR